jgi:hypothetical protein
MNVMRSLKYKAIVLVGALAMFLFTLWYSYDVYVDTGQSDLPLISAPLSIVTKPSNPGGMIVPDKDKDIYNSMSGRMNESENVRVIKNAGHENVSRAEAIAMIQKQIKRSATQEAAHVQAVAKLSTSAFYIRVAKIKSPDVLDRAIQLLYEKYPQLSKLKGKLYEEKSLLGRKYYVHLGPITDRQVAESLCAQLKPKSCAVFSH